MAGVQGQKPDTSSHTPSPTAVFDSTVHTTHLSAPLLHSVQTHTPLATPVHPVEMGGDLRKGEIAHHPPAQLLLLAPPCLPGYAVSPGLWLSGSVSSVALLLSSGSAAEWLSPGSVAQQWLCGCGWGWPSGSMAAAVWISVAQLWLIGVALGSHWLSGSVALYTGVGRTLPTPGCCCCCCVAWSISGPAFACGCLGCDARTIHRCCTLLHS